jgi:hypothetical protein
MRDTIVGAIHNWIKINRCFLPEGDSKHRCTITALPGRPVFDITLCIKVVPLRGPGRLWIRRLQMEKNLGHVIEKALRRKLPKLVRTEAERRILLLERQHMNLYPESMIDEIEKRRATFPNLAAIDEIWIVETMSYETDSYLCFEQYEEGRVIRSLVFHGAELLLDESENGMAVSVRKEP